MIKIPKISISLRLFLFFFLLIGIGLSLQLKVIVKELKPGLRQATEESMVDSANLLAEIATAEFINGNLNNGNFAKAFKSFKNREIQAQIWSKSKVESLVKVYITDAKGIVVYHSEGRDLGKSYYLWNDVYKTLKGQYGARSTEATKGNPLSVEMHVAAPIKVGEQIVGVLTLIKPNLSLLPFLADSQNKVKYFSIIIIIIAIILGLFISYWLTYSIRKLNIYATKISQGKDIVPLPEFIDFELNDLAKAMDNMRQQLEGKNYVESYIHSLTHELKSPVAAIKGAAEILENQLPEKDRIFFLNNIKTESYRLELIINKLLELAALENRKGLENIESVELASLINDLEKSLHLSIHKKQLVFKIEGTAHIEAELFLLRQAIENLLTNAIEFSPHKAEIQITMLKQQEKVLIQIEDQGAGIPEYALDKVFTRFYSLPRLDSGKKSSGLGLSFVKQICYLHQADCKLINGKAGAIAQLIFPVSQTK